MILMKVMGLLMLDDLSDHFGKHLVCWYHESAI